MTTAPDTSAADSPQDLPDAGRVALITGANKGIGLETARQLGERGFTVLIGARDADRGEQAARQLRDEGLDARFVQLDVTDDASVAHAADEVAREVGHLDVLVNNAGTATISRERRSPSQTDLNDMHAVYEVNVFGVVRVTNAMLPLLRRGTHVRIVNVSSEVGSIGARTDPSSPISRLGAVAQYPSSKAAVNMITAQYAKELAGDGILVNAANPGFTDTDFTDHRGIRSASDGAYPSVHLATLPDHGMTGRLWGHIWTIDGDGDGGYGELAW